MTLVPSRQRAAAALARAVLDTPIPPQLQDLAESMVATLLEAGVSMFDVEACADGEDAGVELTVENTDHGPALRVIWHQRRQVTSGAWKAVPISMHRALGDVLTVGGFRVGRLRLRRRACALAASDDSAAGRQRSTHRPADMRHAGVEANSSADRDRIVHT